MIWLGSSGNNQIYIYIYIYIINIYIYIYIINIYTQSGIRDTCPYKPMHEMPNLQGCFSVDQPLAYFHHELASSLCQGRTNVAETNETAPGSGLAPVAAQSALCQ